MGYGLPAAVAAAILQPGRTVVNIAGDGDFLMNGQELATAIAHGAKKLLSIVVDNGTYGTIRMHQEREYPGRVSITATASDDTALRAVEFYVDEVLIGRDSGPPFAVNWNSRKAASGLHLIRVRAIDTSGNVTDQTISVSAR